MEKETKKKGKPKKDEIVPIETILNYYGKGYSINVIAKMLNVSTANITQRIKSVMRKLEQKRPSLSLYVKDRKEFFRLGQMTLLAEALKEDKLKRIPTEKAISAAKQLYEMERLEEGKSTANISYESIVKLEAEILEALKEYEKLNPQIAEVVEVEAKKVEKNKDEAECS